jgi:hypothetical protein
VTEGIAACVSTNAVLTVDMAVSITTVGLAATGVDAKLLQDVKVTATRKNLVFNLLMNFISLPFYKEVPSGLPFVRCDLHGIPACGQAWTLLGAGKTRSQKMEANLRLLLPSNQISLYPDNYH